METVSITLELGYDKITNRKGEVINCSRYARWFNKDNPKWTNIVDINIAYLKQMEEYATSLLKVKGYLFLNNVYEMLGISPSRVGQLVGWIYDEKYLEGDNCVDFGLYAPYNCNFINGESNEVLLDFNVDGIIIDKI